MVQPEANIPYELLKKMIISGNAPSLIFFIIISQYVLRLVFICPCSSSPAFKKAILAMYWVLPSLLLFVVVFLTDRPFKKTIRLCNNICNSALTRCFLKVLTLAAVWGITTMFDGEWYICIMTSNGNYSEIPCKTTRSMEEELIIKNIKTESQIIGFGILCSVCLVQLLGIWLSPVFLQCRKCRRCLKTCRTECIRNCCSLCCKCDPEFEVSFYKLKYNKYLERETHRHLKKQLLAFAQEKAQGNCNKPLNKIYLKELNQCSVEAATTAALKAAAATTTAALEAAIAAAEAEAAAVAGGTTHSTRMTARKGKEVAAAAAKTAEAVVAAAVTVAKMENETTTAKEVAGKKDKRQLFAAAIAA
ncbi:uncharacterized protein LOC134078659 [Sardina pilchardus]|uniref:uncharacterized protein LOC134078659 n=1 Tax=Sardina pilchardus TaxID=27697 RepID=UPI002E14CEF8